MHPVALCQGEGPQLSYWTGDWVGPRFSLGVVKSLCHAGNEPQFSGGPAWKVVNILTYKYKLNNLEENVYMYLG